MQGRDSMIGTVRDVLIGTDPGQVAIGAAVIAAFSVVVTPLNAVLALLLAIAFIIDALSGTLRAYLESQPGEKDWFDFERWKRGAAKKGLVIMLVLVMACVDIAFAAAFRAEWLRDITPFAVYGLLQSLGSQTLSVLRHAGAIAELRPLARALAKKLRTLDPDGGKDGGA